jgi:hypothetical protein
MLKLTIMKTKITILLLAITLSLSAQQPWTSLNLVNNLPGMGERHMAKAVYDKELNTTVATYTGSDNMAWIVAVSHETGDTFSMRVGSLPSGIPDMHSYSVICQSGDGTFLVFYADQRGSVIRMARSNKPHDYKSWTDVSLGFRGQYPMPMVTNEGDVYLIWGFIPKSAKDVPKYGTYRPEYLSISKDNGITWTTRPFMTSYQYVSQLNEFFLNQIIANEDNTKWYTAWTMGGGIAPTGPLHDYFHANVYAAYYMPSTDKWYSCQGVEIGSIMDGGCDNPLAWASWKASEDLMNKYCLVRYTGSIRRTQSGAPSYYQTIVPGTEIIVSGTYHLQNGTWTNIPVKGVTISNVLASEFKEGSYLLYTSSQVYRSVNGIDYLLAANISQPTWPSGGAINAMVVYNSHPSAQVVYLKMNSSNPNGCLRIAGSGEIVTPTPKIPYLVPGSYQVYVNGQSYGQSFDILENAIEIAMPLKVNNPKDIITIGGYNAEILLR